MRVCVYVHAASNTKYYIQPLQQQVKGDEPVLNP